ncbi:Hpt domain-containing protein [Vibrio vulnificus]|uniref:Hpt domain-containing protein n=1 Tax=Vibrio vulnificus TaxID=672 RepID=UPI001A2F1B44|nr:hypothetical protein [Vibrio vulnificus]HAS6405158.1 hypothetical protein [Vibrio vulnificus]
MTIYRPFESIKNTHDDFWLKQYEFNDAIIMCNIFIDSIKNDIEVLRVANETKDFSTLKETSHRLKGSLGSLGLHQIYLDAKELEFMSNNKSEESFSYCYVFILQLENELSNALSWLKLNVNS